MPPQLFSWAPAGSHDICKDLATLSADRGYFCTALIVHVQDILKRRHSSSLISLRLAGLTQDWDLRAVQTSNRISLLKSGLSRHLKPLKKSYGEGKMIPSPERSRGQRPWDVLTRLHIFDGWEYRNTQSLKLRSFPGPWCFAWSHFCPLRLSAMNQSVFSFDLEWMTCPVEVFS